MARLLRMLHALGVVAERESAYSLTTMGSFLRKDAPGSLRDAIMYSCDVEITTWRLLAEGVRTGRTPFEIAHGMNTFEFLAKPENAELARRFNGFMSGLTSVQARALLAVYDFGRHEVVADIGGGDGSLLTAILGAHPRLRGILYDLPHVADAARAKFEAAGVLARCQVVSGSFFDDVPRGGDVYILKFILHDWEDERCTRILENCHRAMTPDARLLLFERVIADPTEDAAAYLEAVTADMHMFVNPGGRERTRTEWVDLLGRGGFAIDRIVRTDVPPSLIEARVA